MREVGIEGLVLWECGGVVVEGRVDGGRGGVDVLGLEAGEEFEDVAHSLRAAGGVAVGS